LPLPCLVFFDGGATQSPFVPYNAIFD